MISIYEAFFTDCVKYRQEDLKINLSEEQIKEIVNKLIYECDNLWEYINDYIDWFIERESD